MNHASSVKESINEKFRDLHSARDEARLRLHLFSLEAKQRWNEIESKFQGIEQRLNQGGERAAEIVLDKAEELTRAIQDLLGEQAVSLTSPVALAMSQRVSTCHGTDTLNVAAQMMWESDCGSVPVVDAGGRLIGIITDRDICMGAFTSGQPLWAIEVSQVMSRDVETIASDAPVLRVLEIMRKRRIRRVPVTNGEQRVVGVVSIADLVRHFGKGDARNQVLSTLSEICSPAKR